MCFQPSDGITRQSGSLQLMDLQKYSKIIGILMGKCHVPTCQNSNKIPQGPLTQLMGNESCSPISPGIRTQPTLEAELLRVPDLCQPLNCRSHDQMTLPIQTCMPEAPKRVSPLPVTAFIPSFFPTLVGSRDHFEHQQEQKEKPVINWQSPRFNRHVIPCLYHVWSRCGHLSWCAWDPLATCQPPFTP